MIMIIIHFDKCENFEANLVSESLVNNVQNHTDFYFSICHKHCEKEIEYIRVSNRSELESCYRLIIEPTTFMNTIFDELTTIIYFYCDNEDFKNKILHYFSEYKKKRDFKYMCMEGDNND